MRLVHPGLTMSGWGLSPSSSAFHTSPASTLSRASSVPSAPASAEPAEDPASDYVRM